MLTSLIDRRSLPEKMIAGFVVVVVLTTVTIGLPAIWLIRQQLDRQAWTLVEQGQRAAEAFCAAQQREIISFARLTAERPTLHELMGQDDRQALSSYLLTLQRAAGYDLIAVCDAGDRPVAFTDESMPGTICSDKTTGSSRLLWSWGL